MWYSVILTGCIIVVLLAFLQAGFERKHRADDEHRVFRERLIHETEIIGK